jgi:hypothetical protein
MKRLVALPVFVLMSYLLVPGTALACIADNQAGCGTNDSLCCHGDCDGNVCKPLQAGGTVCTDGLDCAGGFCTSPSPLPLPAPACGGATVCGAALGAACNLDIDCIPSLVCTGSLCVAKFPTGHTCVGNSRCVSGNCAGGLCAKAIVDQPCLNVGDCIGAAGTVACQVGPCNNSLGWCCNTHNNGACGGGNQKICCTGVCQANGKCL